MEAPAISVKHLVKRYGVFTAVDDVSFDVPAGSIFAFLGTNGAGKTTTISCLTTITGASAGTIEVHGHAVGHADDLIRRDIGVVFQSSLLDPLLTVRENLRSRARFYNLGANTDARIAELVELIDLKAIVDKPYGTLSGGQKRRADIARALLHKPSILFLDEPTAGLDPQSRETVWQAVYGLQAKTGLTVFLTTHYMEETERADTVYVIDKGSIIAHGTPTDLRASYAKDILTLTLTQPAQLAKSLRSEGYHVTQKGDVCSVAVGSSQAALNILKRHEKQITDFEFRHGSMDDVFLQLTRSHEGAEA